MKSQFIDNLKFFGSLLVMSYHATGILGLPTFGGGIAYYIQKYGWLPVELFFWSSGYFMHLKYSGQIKEEKICFNEYIKKRLRKIYPIYFISLLIAIFLRGFLYKDRKITFWDLIVNVLTLNTGVFYIDGSEWRNDIGWATWYIGVLVILYILFFYINKLIRDKDNKTIVYLLLIIIGINGMGVGNSFLYNFYVQRGVVGFFSGALIALQFSECRLSSIKFKNICYIGFTFSLVMFLETLHQQQLGNAKIIAIFDCVLMPLLFIVVQNCVWLGKLLNMRCVKNAGALSTYIYFFHYPVIMIYSRALRAFGLKTGYWSVYIGLAICMIIISEVCIKIEKNVYNYRNLQIMNK